MKKVLISPSVLSVPSNQLIEKIAILEQCGAEYLHFDIMDGKFVPNTSFSVQTLKDISDKHNMVNDVHIMIEEPYKFALDYINAGADLLTFHYEACNSDDDVINVIKLIKENGCKVGLSIKPKTPVKNITKFLGLIDLVLVMSVEPGFGGQSFISSALDKISFLRSYIDDNKLNCLIEVDGGINAETGKLCVNAGVDVLVAGSYVFKGDQIKERIESLR